MVVAVVALIAAIVAAEIVLNDVAIVFDFVHCWTVHLNAAIYSELHFRLAIQRKWLHCPIHNCSMPFGPCSIPHEMHICIAQYHDSNTDGNVVMDHVEYIEYVKWIHQSMAEQK